MRKSKSKPVIMSSAVGSLSAMALINKLKEKKAKIVGLDSEPLSAGLYLCDKSYVVPVGNDSRFLKKVLKICEKEKPNLILVGPEEEILVLAKNKKIIEKKGAILLCPDYETVAICSDKFKTYKFLKKISIPIPKIFTEKNVKFPCIVKPKFGRGGNHVFIASSKTEMRSYLSKINHPIIQEYVKGTEFSVDVFSDLKGNPLSIIPRIRLSTESGISVKGITINDSLIIKYCKKISKKLRLIGPSCIQCIKNEKGVKFIEINTRFGGGSILSLEADPSIVTNLIKMAKKQDPSSKMNFKEGLIMLRYYSEIFVDKNKILSRFDS